MKVSINSIRAFNQRYGCAEDIAAIGHDKLLEKVGAQLGAIDEVINLGQKYKGLVIAKVVSCEKHQEADKLSICKIYDAGTVKDVRRDEQGHVQVVCGAPNVAEGQIVVWLPPGVAVPESVGKDPMVLDVREIRGALSNGMLASPKELALGDSHQGILVLEGDYQIGSDFAEVFDLKDDLVLDIENKMFTHRPDCFGMLGVARELAGIQGMKYKSPDWYQTSPTFPVQSADLPLKFVNEVPELVPRFTLITMSDVKVGPSPTWLVIELAKLGQKSINNIVDYTNFFMLETGQPLHAYDYDKVKALSGAEPTIVVRNPRSTEKLKLLNGKEINPRENDIVIATDKQLIGLGGVMGGSETEVDTNTNNIIIEVANFDMYSIRRASMAHGLFTDAVTRFNKGQSPLQNLAVLAKIVDEIVKSNSGKVASKPIDYSRLDASLTARQSLRVPVKVSAEFINLRLGLELGPEQMKTILQNVEFKVELSDQQLTVTAPFWRTDIELREDIVEEIGRLYGYDHLPHDLPKRNLMPTPRDQSFDLKAAIRQKLSRAGANEVLTYSFVPDALLQKTGQDPAKAFQVSNAQSPDLQNYRISLMPSLLDKVHANIKVGYDRFALFEIGKTHDLDHLDDDGLPVEFEFTALVVTAADKLRPKGSAYYQAAKYLRELAGQNLVFKPVGDEMKQYPVVQPYDHNRSALVSTSDGTFIGIIGEFKPSVARSLKLPAYTAGFELDTKNLAYILAGPTYQPLSRFPSVSQDITLKAPAAVNYAQISELVKKTAQDNSPEDCRLDVSGIDIFQKEKGYTQTTFRVTLVPYSRTLTDKDASKLIDVIAQAAQSVQASQV